MAVDLPVTWGSGADGDRDLHAAETCRHLGYGMAPPTDADVARHRHGYEPDRLALVWDDGEVVACGYGLTLDISAPGGADLTCQGLRGIAVAPTHRRRGLLAAILGAHLAQAHERGEAVAALFASEYPIYGRFGWGRATQSRRVTAVAHRVALTADAHRLADRATGPVRLVDGATALAVAPAVYDRARRDRAGMFARPVAWWPRSIDPSAVDWRTAVVGPAGAETGFARHRIEASWGHGGPDSTMLVGEVVATDPASEAALWRYLLTADLVRTWKASMRPIDDPVALLLADERGWDSLISDGLWLRPIDVGVALTGRTYAGSGALTLEVVDHLCPWNAGRWRLEVDATGAATCAPTTAAPDLTLPAAAVGASLLGGTALAALWRAGLVDEHREGALRLADALLHSPVAPWCANWL